MYNKDSRSWNQYFRFDFKAFRIDESLIISNMRSNGIPLKLRVHVRSWDSKGLERKWIEMKNWKFTVGIDRSSTDLDTILVVDNESILVTSVNFNCLLREILFRSRQIFYGLLPTERMLVNFLRVNAALQLKTLHVNHLSLFSLRRHDSARFTSETVVYKHARLFTVLLAGN